jgi:putative membrane protein
LVLAIVIGSIAISLFSAFVRWRTFSYTLEDDEIRIDSGLLNRTHRSLPFDRIQDVDITQGPVARVLGVARVKLETGGSGAGNDEGVLQSILLDEAEALRHRVRSRRSGVSTSFAVEAERTVATEPPPIFVMDMKRLLLAGVFNFSLALFAGLAGASQTFGDAFGIDPFERSFWRQMETLFGPFAAVIIAHKLIAALAGSLVLLTVGLITGLVRTILRDFGFRVDRTDAGLRRRRGLLTKTDVTLQVRRVQAALVRSGPVRAAFGWFQLHLQSLAQDEAGKDDHIIAPFASLDEVDALLAELRLRPISGVRGWQPVSRAYLWTFLIVTTPLYLVAVGQAFVTPWLGLGLAIALAAAQFSRVLAWRRTAFAHDGDRILVRGGWWQRRIAVLPASNIQSVDLSESIVSRWFGTATLTFGVAGGKGHDIPAVPRETARKLRSELLSLAA